MGTAQGCQSVYTAMLAVVLKALAPPGENGTTETVNVFVLLAGFFFRIQPLLLLLIDIWMVNPTLLLYLVLRR